MFKNILFVFSLGAGVWAAPLQLEPALDAQMLRISTQILDHRYEESMRLLAHPNTVEEKVFKAMIYMARFDDLGNESDLNSAQNLLNQASTQKPLLSFWEGFIKVQQGYILAAQGHEFKGATVSREGSLILAQIQGNSDAQGFGAIYRFYKDQMLGKLNPWSKPSLAEKQIVAQSLNESRYFKSLFASALGWMDFDLKNYSQTAKIAFGMVEEHPQNRPFRQMAGDALRRSQNYKSAKVWYQKSVEQYAKIAPGSLRHVCALANMRLISQALGEEVALQNYTTEYNKYISRQKDRMPPSLVKELDKHDLWD